MREIKFRAWDKNLQVMFPVVGMDFIEHEVCCRGAGMRVGKWEVELMQYTGLKDKNGKEIYEGDIVSDTKPPFPEDKMFEIGWDDYNAGFSLRTKTSDWPKREDGHSYASWIYEVGRFEVIGNIYENKELLDA